MGKKYADMTPEEKAKHRAYVRAYRERNRVKVANFQRSYREANGAKLRRDARLKYRRSVGLEGEGTVRVVGVGVPLVVRRLSHWIRPGFAELVAAWTYQQARFNYAEWCDRIEAEMDRELESKARAELYRAQAAARNSSPWRVERIRDERGFVVWRSRGPLARPFR